MIVPTYCIEVVLKAMEKGRETHAELSGLPELKYITESTERSR